VDKNNGKKGVKVLQAVNGELHYTATECHYSHKGSHSVTCYLTPVNAPRLHPSQTGWYSIYWPFKDGGLSKRRSRVQRATGPCTVATQQPSGQLASNPPPSYRDHFTFLLVTHIHVTQILW